MGSIKSIKSGARPPIRVRKSDRSKKKHVPILTPEEHEQLERDQQLWLTRKRLERNRAKIDDAEREKRRQRDEEVEEFFAKLREERAQKG